MNKDYIKRLIILNELNISIDEEIKYYIDLFKSKYVDENIEKFVHGNLVNYTFWTLDEDIIFYYSVYGSNIWIKYDIEILKDSKLIECFKILFEYYYKVKVNEIYSLSEGTDLKKENIYKFENEESI